MKPKVKKQNETETQKKTLTKLKGEQIMQTAPIYIRMWMFRNSFFVDCSSTLDYIAVSLSSASWSIWLPSRF